MLDRSNGDSLLAHNADGGSDPCRRPRGFIGKIHFQSADLPHDARSLKYFIGDEDLQLNSTVAIASAAERHKLIYDESSARDLNIFIHQTTGSINNSINKINKRKMEKNDVVMYSKYTVFQAL